MFGENLKKDPKGNRDKFVADQTLLKIFHFFLLDRKKLGWKLCFFLALIILLLLIVGAIIGIVLGLILRM